MTKIYHLYVLLCVDGSLYTGIAQDPQERLKQHLQGKGSRYVASRLPVKIIYTEVVGSLSEALKREAQVKSWNRSNKIKNLRLNLA